MPFATINPATGKTEKEFPAHTPEEVEAILAQAMVAFAEYRTTTYKEHARHLLTAAELLEGEVPGRGAHPHHGNGQDLRRRQGRGLQVCGRPALVRRQRRGAAGRRADPHLGLELVGALPAARCRAGDHAVELPDVAGHPLRRPGPHGRQRGPAQARVQRAADRPGHRGPVPAGGPARRRLLEPVRPLERGGGADRRRASPPSP